VYETYISFDWCMCGGFCDFCRGYEVKELRKVEAIANATYHKKLPSIRRGFEKSAEGLCKGRERVGDDSESIDVCTVLCNCHSLMMS
jgi:hypothetical protein